MQNVVRENNCKAVLHDVPGEERHAVMLMTEEAAVKWGEQILSTLNEQQQERAFVRISKQVEVLVCDIHPAKVRGEFAVARYLDGKKAS
jgi:hypothetical protein